MVDLEAIFPGLHDSTYQITSPSTGDYNCIAWAAGDVGRWWWPDLAGKRYWPAGVPRDETVAAFQDAFHTLGFVVCAGDGLEPGVEKIALFADDEGPQHAARQLPNGRWTSKLGELEDIEHTLRELEGVDYGKVVAVMQRPNSRP
jgi:hypothetical protein